MDFFFNLIYNFSTYFPIILIGGFILWFTFKFFRQIMWDISLSEGGFTLKNLIFAIDPYRQSFIFFKYNIKNIILLIISFAAFSYYYVAVVDHYSWGVLFKNFLTQFPSYLIHEFSHRLVCPISFSRIICLMAGNGGEIFWPIVLYIFSLRLRGGRYLTPFSLGWLCVSFYSTGTYMADARASKFPLTSSDMLTNLSPGEAHGDWYYIFDSLNMLDYDVIIGNIFIVLACFCFIMAIFSLYQAIFRYELNYEENIHRKYNF